MDQAKRVILEIFKNTIQSVKQQKDNDDSVRSYLFYHPNKVKAFMLAKWRDYENTKDISFTEEEKFYIVNHLTITDLFYYLNKKQSRKMFLTLVLIPVLIPFLIILLL